MKILLLTSANLRSPKALRLEYTPRKIFARKAAMAKASCTSGDRFATRLLVKKLRMN